MSKDLMIDVAVLCQEYTQVDFNCNNANMVSLDPIDITEESFREIFYPYGENFGMDKNIKNKKNLDHYITFLAPHRTLKNGKKFFLLDEIITNIENDLNISRNAFTTTSLIDLTNDLSKIKSLSDINCCSVLSSLPWSVITNLLEDYHLANTDNQANLDALFEEPTKKRPEQLIFVVSVVFKTPTPGVRNTIIRFPYVIR
jgi:hypothetical protein